MPEDIQALNGELRNLVKLMQDNGDEMRQQDSRLKNVESLLQEKNDKLQEEITATQEKIDALIAEGRSPRVETVEDSRSEYDHAFEHWVRKGTEMATPEQQRAMSVNSDENGGFLVSPVFGGILATRVYDTSPVRQFAGSVTISTDAYEGIADNDQATVGWVAETAARTVTATPTLDKVRIPTHEQYARPQVTQKLLDDSAVNVESWLAGKVADRMGRAESTAFVTGTGVGQPRGFTTYAAGTTWGTVEQIPSLDANTLTGDGLINLVYALQVQYRAGARFFMNRATEGVVRLLTDSQDRYLWQPGIEMGAPAVLLGYPVGTFEDLADVAASSLSVAFGDMRQAYLIVERMGTRVLRDPYTNPPYVRFYTTRRVGGDLVNFDAIKIQDTAAS